MQLTFGFRRDCATVEVIITYMHVLMASRCLSTYHFGPLSTFRKNTLSIGYLWTDQILHEIAFSITDGPSYKFCRVGTFSAFQSERLRSLPSMCKGGLLFPNTQDRLSHACPISGGIVHRRSCFGEICIVACYLLLTHFVDLGTKIFMSILIQQNQYCQLSYPLSLLALETRGSFSVTPQKLKGKLDRAYGICENHYVYRSLSLSIWYSRKSLCLSIWAFLIVSWQWVTPICNSKSFFT